LASATGGFLFVTPILQGLALEKKNPYTTTYFQGLALDVDALDVDN